MSCDTCSECIAKLFCACFHGVSHNITRYVATWGIAQMCLCENKVLKAGIVPIRGAADLPVKKSRSMRYRSDSIAISHNMGPLRTGHLSKNRTQKTLLRGRKLPQPVCWYEIKRILSRKRGGVQKSMGNNVPWKTGMLIYPPVTSRPLISLQKEAVFITL